MTKHDHDWTSRHWRRRHARPDAPRGRDRSGRPAARRPGVPDVTVGLSGAAAVAAGSRHARARWHGGHGFLGRGPGSTPARRAGRRRRGRPTRPHGPTCARQLRPLDAYAAARAALSGTATGTPKTRTGPVGVDPGATGGPRHPVKARTQATNHLKALLLAGPAELREQLRHLSTTTLVATCARLRPTQELSDPEQATKAALRRLARRHLQLNEENTRRRVRTHCTASAPLRQSGSRRQGRATPPGSLDVVLRARGRRPEPMSRPWAGRRPVGRSAGPGRPHPTAR